MDLNTITVQNFKDLFFRDFPYLPVWDNSVVYNAGSIVYYTPGNLFYKAKVNAIPAATLPTNTMYWELYADSTFNYVLDEDVEKAFQETQMVFNQSLFGSDAKIQLAYLYLTAHYLSIDLRNAQNGIASTGQMLLTGRTVGSVSESYTIPKKYQDNPYLAIFTTTGYGMKYLSMLLPRMIGNVGVVCGWTTP